MALISVGEPVPMSITTAPGRRAPAAPSGPNRAFSVSEDWGSMVMTTSAPDAAPAGLGAIAAPAEAAASRAFGIRS